MMARERHGTCKAKLKALNLKDTDESPLNDAENEEADDLVGRIGKAEQRLARLEAAEGEAADKAKEVDEEEAEKTFGAYARKSAPSIVRADTVLVPRQKGSAFSRFVAGRVVDKLYSAGAGAQYVAKHFGDTAVVKALTTATPVIPQDFTKDLIELLREQSVVRAAGARVMSMPMGQLTIPRQRLGATATWLGEGQDLTATSAGFDAIQLTWKKLGAITSVTKELVEFSPLDVESIVTTDLVAQMALAEDIEFLNGTGSAYRPTGIIAQTASSNLLPSNATVNFANVVADLRAVELALNVNLVYGPKAWFMHPGVVGFLKTLSNGFGIYPFAEELEQGKLLGYPVHTTVQLPTNLGGSTNQTKIILAAVNDLIIGDAYRTEVSVTTEGSWVESAATVNSFSRDLIGIKATNSVDFAMKHGVSAAVLTATGWSVGAAFNVAGKQYVTEAANTSPSSASSANPA
jgi:HK97 family phage major capsid protein